MDDSKTPYKKSAINISIIGAFSLFFSALIKVNWMELDKSSQDFCVTIVPIVAAVMAEFMKGLQKFISRERAYWQLRKLKERTEKALEDQLLSDNAKKQVQEAYDSYCMLEIDPNLTLESVRDSRTTTP